MKNTKSKAFSKLVEGEEGEGEERKSAQTKF